MHHPGRALLFVGAAGLIAAGGGVVRADRGRRRPARRRPRSTPRSSTSTASSCHDDDEKKGGLALDAVALAGRRRSIRTCGRRSSASCARVRCRRSGRRGRTRRPTTRSIASLETSLDRAAAAQPESRAGPTTFRRLNRTEYQNAIRDLLALEVDVAALLPADESSHGFDNVTVGDLSPTLLDRYISAAQKISRLAVGQRRPRRPAATRSGFRPDLTQEEHVEGLPLGTRGGALDPLHVPAGRRVRDPDSADARPQRARRGPAASRTSWSCCSIASARAAVHGEAAAARRREHADRSIST